MNTIADGLSALVAGALGRRYACRLLRFAVAAVLLVAASLEIAHADQRAEKSEGQVADYVDAIMGHVHLRIPRDHLFFGVTRPGENWLDPKSKSTAKDPREIESFDLLLWPDFQPIRAGSDRERWENQRKTVRPGVDTREVVVVVETLRDEKLSQAPSQAQKLRNLVARKVAARQLVYGEAREIGLVKWSPSDLAGAQLWENDVYHDSTYTTVIMCGPPGRSLANPLEVCRQILMIEGYPFWISARYTAAYLPNWRTLRDRLIELIGSFIVVASR